MGGVASRSVLALLAVALAATTASACDGSEASDARACSLVGCVEGVVFETARLQRAFPAAERVELCVDAKCRRYRADLVAAPINPPTLSPHRSAEVTVTVTGRGGKEIARFAKTVQPRLGERINGPGCPPPPCLSTTVVVRRTGLQEKA